MPEAEVTLSNGKKLMTLATGKIVEFADGSGFVKMGNTRVLSTCVSKSHTSTSSGFLPLTVDYQQELRHIVKRPTNRYQETLTSRYIDRSVRPLFPSDYLYDIQLSSHPIAKDGINDPDVLAINAASLALATSDIPWNGPVAAVRVGLIDNEVVIMPTRHEREKSNLELIVTAVNNNNLVMLDGYADKVLIQDVKKAIKQGVKECQLIIQGIKKLSKDYGKIKREYEPVIKVTDELKDTIKSIAEIKLRDIFSDYKHDKMSRDKSLNNLRNNILETMKKSVSDLDLSAVVETFNVISKEIFRSLIFENDIRCDGRKLTDLRDIKCIVGEDESLHGSALFQRGQTRVHCTVTLDSLETAAKMDRISMLKSGIKDKNFYLDYVFPPYATNEIGKFGPPGRREIGHGALGGRGLYPIVPDDYPFTVGINSEVLSSNGSSSMATVCGGSLAMLDAGVPISSPASGVAIGVVTKYNNSSPDKIEDYRILTDLLGIEDYLGDMDFKIAGTDKAITSLQADIKIPGMPLSIIMESLNRAHTANNKIINIMNAALSKPRVGKPNMPVSEIIEVPIHQRGKFLGSGGRNINRIYEITGVTITNQDENCFSLFAPNETAMKEAKDIIDELLVEDKVPEFEFGGIYTAKIVEMRDNGVMLTLHPNMRPAFVHVSQLDTRSVVHPSALGFDVDHELKVKYFGRDPTSGFMRLSRKAIIATGAGPEKNFHDQK
ncbi:hypothetical protein HCN44_001413 [Aphidius gifuensis]|uniref:polyribonucleotide nucleotidyltransferase n=2 Tax=Aphidius gifuensis TaxID=684658 RepID=A0A835CSB1_APHGI|nr:hypothetical protein HCN44_001413 [Aphidius gifuensis]